MSQFKSEREAADNTFSKAAKYKAIRAFKGGGTPPLGITKMAARIVSYIGQNAMHDAPKPQGAKRIGDLLVESGYVQQSELKRALEYGQKTGLPLGRVLLMLRGVSEEGLKHALHAQSLMRFENLDGALAVKALRLCYETKCPLEDALKNVGWVSRKSQTVGEQEELQVLRQRLMHLEKIHGTHNQELVPTLIEIADYFAEQELFGQAEGAYRRALEIQEKNFGTNSLQAAGTLWKLANQFFIQERFPEAEPLYLCVLNIKEGILGSNHQEVATALQELGELHDFQGNYKEAEKFYLRCLQIRETLFAFDDKVVIDAIKRLVYVYKHIPPDSEPITIGELLTKSGAVEKEKIDQGLALSDQARIPLGQALIHMKYLSDDGLRNVLHAQMLIRNGFLPRMLAMRALRLSIARNQRIEQTLTDLGWLAHEDKSSEDFLELLRTADALIALERRLSPNHPEVATLCLRLADAFVRHQKYAEAERFMVRALSIVETGGETIQLATVLERLANVYVCQEKTNEAENLLRQSLDIRRRLLGDSHLDISLSYVSFAEFFCKKGNHEEAGNWLDKAVQLKENALGAEHEDVAALLERRGDCNVHDAQYELAEPLYWKSYEIRKARRLPNDPVVIAVLTKLADLYSRQDKYTLADAVLVLLQGQEQIPL